MIYFSSDLHLNHNKDFIYRARGFEDIYEHNNHILLNFHKVIKPEDDLYLLGDSLMGNSEEGIKLFNQLPGKIHVLWGNHCTTRRQELMSQAWNVVEVLGYAAQVKLDGYHFYLSHYPTLVGNYDDNDRPLTKRLINLCGHTHTTDKFSDFNKGLIYHVDVDAHNCFPVSLEEIVNDIRKEVRDR